MEITAEQLRADPGRYIVYDIRSERERAYGTIPDSYGSTAEELLNTPPTDRSRPLVILCAHGIVSLDVAEALEARGYEAYSLRGGYLAWLRADLQDKQEEEVRARVEQSLRKKFRTPLMSQFTKALKAYRLVNEGDRVAVCISGGKDSMLMAKLFQELKRYSPVSFDVQYVVMDPGYNPENRRIIEDNARLLGIPITVFESNIFESVYNVEKSPCYLCARMRRGYLYGYAQRLGCNKIALGHHFDDVIETNLMGMLYSGQLQTMMPKLHSTNFEGMELIRPMYCIHEDDIIAWKKGRFVFSDMPLETIAKQLERWYDVEIRFDDIVAKYYRFTGVMKRYNELEQVLGLIEETTNVRFKVEGCQVRVFRNL